MNFTCLVLTAYIILPAIRDTPILFIYKYEAGAASANENQMTKIFPDDSIFYYKGYAIEKDMKIFDIQTKDSFSRTAHEGRLYLIDFNKQRFTEIADSANKKPLYWRPLSEKKFGIQTNFIYYENEPFNKKDTLIRSSKQFIISYIRIAPGRPENAALFTLYFVPELSGPAFIPNLERRFRARVRKIKVIYPANQGQALISLESRNGSSLPLTRKVSELIRFYHLPAHQ